jgi:type II secretory pathway pseudopilin PulG
MTKAMKRRRKGPTNRRSGLTLIELIVAFTIVLILSTMALPLARVKVQREKERRLRDALVEMRQAIDRYKDMADAGKLGSVDPDSFGYPPNLEVLVEGVEISAGAGDPMGFGEQGQNFGQPAGSRSRSRSGSRGFGQSSGRQGFGGSSGGSGFGQSSNRGFGQSGNRGFGQSGNSGFGQSSNRGFGQSRNRRSEERGSASGEPGSAEEEGEQKVRFLRRIPVDPTTGSADWGMRAVQDSPDSMSWGGKNVFDVYSKSMDTSLDGTRYSDW